MQAAYSNNIITKEEYKNLLIAPNRARFTPLHQALTTGQPGNMQAYFKAVQAAYSDRIITQKAYKDLLIAPNATGFTPLHQALITGQPENMQAYFKAVQAAYSDRIITQNEYRDLLIAPNAAGFTPLHSALKSGKPENMQAYFLAVKAAYSNNIITKEEYKNLLTQSNKAGFTPLHQAANSNSLKVLNDFFAELKSAFSPEEIGVLLRVKAKGIMPNCQTHNANHKEINDYLQNQRQVYPEHSSNTDKGIFYKYLSNSNDLARKSSEHISDEKKHTDERKRSASGSIERNQATSRNEKRTYADAFPPFNRSTSRDSDIQYRDNKKFKNYPSDFTRRNIDHIKR